MKSALQLTTYLLVGFGIVACGTATITPEEKAKREVHTKEAISYFSNKRITIVNSNGRNPYGMEDLQIANDGKSMNLLFFRRGAETPHKRKLISTKTCFGTIAANNFRTLQCDLLDDSSRYADIALLEYTVRDGVIQDTRLIAPAPDLPIKAGQVAVFLHFSPTNWTSVGEFVK